MTSIDERVRQILARALDVEPSALTPDFHWLDAMGVEDTGWFLSDLEGEFTTLPQGFSFGDGQRLFNHLNADQLEKIATVGGLIEAVRQHLAKTES